MCLQTGEWFVFFLVFFFKQKSAYEMRISDWSSDVCSSDLKTLFHRTKAGDCPADGISPGSRNTPTRPPRRRWRAAFASVAHRRRPETATPSDRHEIGRAACRGRECQYV